MKYVIDLPEKDATFLTTSSFIPIGYFEEIHEALGNAIPFDSVLDDIKAELPSLARYQSADGQDLILATDIATLIDNYIKGGAENETDN